ncbi:MAG TPA: EI24 domain-containing protein [Burkholderiales bacterium]|nr:EI24 domain-containing protein [Burkholderiales bacterium]
MSAVARALALAIADACRPRMLALMLLPAAAALLLWSLAAWVYWGTWTGWVAHLVSGSALAQSGSSWGGWLLSSASALLVIAFLVPAVIVTALLVNEAVVMPLLLAYVRDRHYPHLQRNGFGTAVGSLANAAASAALFIVLWLVTLPLWLTGIGALIVPLLNSAYLNMRIFRYDALAEHASPAEFAAIKRAARGQLYALGVAVSALYYVPGVNLVAPVVSALAYTHLCLHALQRVRGSGGRT